MLILFSFSQNFDYNHTILHYFWLKYTQHGYKDFAYHKIQEHSDHK